MRKSHVVRDQPDGWSVVVLTDDDKVIMALPARSEEMEEMLSAIWDEKGVGGIHELWEKAQLAMIPRASVI